MIAYALARVSLCFADCQVMTGDCHRRDSVAGDVILHRRYRLLVVCMTLTCVTPYTLHYSHLTC